MLNLLPWLGRSSAHIFKCVSRIFLIAEFGVFIEEN